MNNQNPQPKFNPMRVIKKLFLSAFVVITFIGYALHKPANTVTGQVGLAGPTPSAVPPQENQPNTPVTGAQAVKVPTATAEPQQGFIPAPTQAVPTLVPPTTAPTAPNTVAQNGQYKDGTYTGQEEDARYGLVQVQVVVQNGKITDVQVPEYPNDRRTSVRINSFAVPTLQQEAVQAQSSNVDLVTGATLTSEAFQASLQTALSKAKGAL